MENVENPRLTHSGFKEREIEGKETAINLKSIFNFLIKGLQLGKRQL